MSDTVRYVGDPFVDAGVAVLECRLQKSHSSFSRSECEEQAQWLSKEYEKKIWAGYLTVHFPNSGWCNPTMSAEKKSAFRNVVLCGFDLPYLDRACVYCRRPAQDLADRSKIPLLTGAVNMTTGPGGRPGLPVCAFCLYAIQFYPLATLKIEGKPLFWWSFDSRWLYYLTEDFTEQVRIVSAASSEAFPSVRWPSTRLLESLSRVLNRVKKTGGQLQPADVIGCHTTNYGSGPSYDEIRIPASLLSFLNEARTLTAYQSIVQANWEASKPKGKKKSVDKTNGKPPEHRNFFFEDLGQIVRSGENLEAALGIARRYFVKLRDSETRSFQLARLFLERVGHMTRERLDAIERLANRIAESSIWKDSVARLFQAKNVIRCVVDIQVRLLNAKQQGLASRDVYEAFDIVSPDDSTFREAGFVRDLILLKILELRGEAALPEVDQEVA